MTMDTSAWCDGKKWLAYLLCILYNDFSLKTAEQVDDNAKLQYLKIYP